MTILLHSLLSQLLQSAFYKNHFTPCNPQISMTKQHYLVSIFSSPNSESANQHFTPGLCLNADNHPFIRGVLISAYSLLLSISIELFLFLFELNTNVVRHLCYEMKIIKRRRLELRA